MTKELGKIIDYATRWLEFEEGLNSLAAQDFFDMWPGFEKQLKTEK